jgi:hypothetical protein
MGWVTGTEKVAVILPAPRIVTVVDALPGKAKVIPPALAVHMLKR